MAVVFACPGIAGHEASHVGVEVEGVVAGDGINGLLHRVVLKFSWNQTLEVGDRDFLQLYKSNGTTRTTKMAVVMNIAASSRAFLADVNQANSKKIRAYEIALPKANIFVVLIFFIESEIKLILRVAFFRTRI